jgi:hypothetical protein
MFTIFHSVFYSSNNNSCEILKPIITLSVNNVFKCSYKNVIVVVLRVDRNEYEGIQTTL